MRIGNDCEFRSAEWSNLAGLNRRCTLATLSNSARIEIGDGCGFSGAVIGAGTHITIGNRVLCGANVTITDTDWHPVRFSDRESGKAEALPVTIDDGVWLGMNVVVLKGVDIGAHAVVAANSVVTKPIPGGVIAAGAPAKVVRILEEQSISSVPC